MSSSSKTPLSRRGASNAPRGGSPTRRAKPSKAGAETGRASLFDRLQSSPTASSAQAGKPGASKQREAALKRERKEEAARAAARAKEKKRKDQLWRALEVRSVSRLQAAYRGRRGRVQARSKEESMPETFKEARSTAQAAIMAAKRSVEAAAVAADAAEEAARVSAEATEARSAE
jgi:hypothetical protein